jgi:cyclase
VLAKRVIVCLDVAGGRVVKGRRFKNLKDQGDPALLARRYREQGADELVFLDIAASAEGRDTAYAWVKDVAGELDIPFTVGGGIRDLGAMEKLLELGADKISLSTAAVLRPELIREAAEAFGSQFVVLSVDALDISGRWWVTVRGGRERRDLSLWNWLEEVLEKGAGEILLNVINADGMKEGFDIAVLKQVSDFCPCPVIASGGGGRAEHFVELFRETACQAGLAASIFHEASETVASVKVRCREKGIRVRL